MCQSSSTAGVRLHRCHNSLVFLRVTLSHITRTRVRIRRSRVSVYKHAAPARQRHRRLSLSLSLSLARDALKCILAFACGSQVDTPIRKVCSACASDAARSRLPTLGRGDDPVGNPHRAQISQFKLFELTFLNSSFSSLSSS